MQILEAFRALRALDEDIFDTSPDGLTNLGGFMSDSDDLADNSIDVMVTKDQLDSNGNVPENIVGKVILTCPVCRCCTFKDPTDIVWDAEAKVANVGEECPCCATPDGFNISGEVTEYNMDDADKSDEDEVEDADDIDDEETDVVEESFNRRKTNKFREGYLDIKPGNNVNIPTHGVCKVDSVEEDGKDVVVVNGTDKRGLKAKMSMPKVNAVVDVEPLDSTKFQLGDTVATDGTTDFNGDKKPLNDSMKCIREGVLERIRKHRNESMSKSQRADNRHSYSEALSEKAPKISKGNAEKINKIVEDAVLSTTVLKYGTDESEVSNFVRRKGQKGHITYHDDGRAVTFLYNYKLSGDLTFPKGEHIKLGDKIKNDINRTFDGVCSDVNVKLRSQHGAEIEVNVVLDSSYRDKMEIVQSDYYTESIEDLSMTANNTHLDITEDETGKVTVSMGPADSADGGEMISPLSDETEAEIMSNTAEGEEDSLDNAEDGDTAEYDMDEVEGEELEELGESYLKRVYENVRAYKVTGVKSTGNKLIVEGKIKFSNNNIKNTNFIFEAHTADNKGNVTFKGHNEVTGANGLTLHGRMKNKTLIPESLSYNYRALNEGKSVKVLGSVRV